MAAAPSFAATPKFYYGQATVANTGRDGTGTLVTMLTAGGSGEKVTEIAIQAAVTTTAGMIRFFVSKDSGATKRLLDEFPVAAVTVSSSVAGFRAVKSYDNLILESGDILYASTNNAEAINVFVCTGQF